MIWRVLSCYADLAGQDIRLSATAAYAMLDGLFQQALPVTSLVALTLWTYCPSRSAA